MPGDPASAARERTPFRQVFADELQSWIARRRATRTPPGNAAPEQFAPERAFDLRLAGLALSGGGIRSATFNLGLLQALAEKGVLEKMDYLSTVSGGGYIGASLTSLCASGAGVTPETFPFRSEGGIERPEAAHIRTHGGYLATRRGPLRIDIWRMISSYLTGLVLILLTVAVILGFVAYANLGWAEGAIHPGLLQKPPHELWMALVQKRLADADFERVPDRRLHDEFVKWAEAFHRVVLDQRLKKNLETWIDEAHTLPTGKLRELLDVRLFACREYANDRERLWADLVHAIPEPAVEQFASLLKFRVGLNELFLPESDSRTDLDRLQEEVLGNHRFGTLGEWWKRKVQNSVARGRFTGLPDAELKNAFEDWRQDDFFVLVGDPHVSLPAPGWVRNRVTRSVNWVRRTVLGEDVKDPGMRETVDAWIALWDAARILATLPVDVAFAADVGAMQEELWMDVWTHPAPHARAFFTPVGVGLVLWAFWGLLFLVASVFPWKGRKGREHRLPRLLRDVMGYALASVGMLMVLGSVPFAYAAVFSLGQVQTAGLSTLAVSALSLLGSRRLGEGQRPFARKLKRFLFALGAWLLIALFCVSVICFVLYRLLHGSYSYPVSLDVLFIAMILLALVTDINRASLLYFYRDRLAAAFVIRRPAPDANPVPGIEDGVQEITEGAAAGIGRRGLDTLVRGLYSLGGWPLGALALATLVLSGERTDRGVAYVVAFALAYVLLASGAVHAVVRWWNGLLWRSRALADVRGGEKETDVFVNDDLRLSAIPASGPDAPYHLINAAVNLAGSEDLKLRGRKADFFVLSPLYCGSEVTGYVRTGRFERSLDNLATAMAVSGAATNPLYGRASRSAYGFLMALCNLRLGMWVQNPRYVRHATEFGQWLREALVPLRRFWPWYIVLELLGRSDERRRHVNLSDGGHIENLGVFELLRRRCRVIIASDAGADPGYAFEDLADLTRMARVDLGVQVGRVDQDLLRPNESTGLSARHAVAGNIKYLEGAAHLIYVKAALTRDDPQDVHGYQRREPAFPHETTLDQFFNEGQFESYRMLGYESGLAAADLYEKLVAS